MNNKIVASLFYALGMCLLIFAHNAQALSSQQYTFNTSNQLDSVNDSGGMRVKYIYDKNGDVVRRIVDPNLFRNGDFEAAGNGEVASDW
ncbi:hypothetical protein BBG47_24805 [Paenibacillus sp. KS1]|uniref:hypothetical protein n=1 Tax=Paenibacillus sp. KS1 TaxID=1849249 RepID=UPI0008065E5F|nr:hypothetical protein [Paenibacillus sp. KS1]OBY76867.1 hypothetical protein BBG47_24805 [Paenibacillus sp. KS1]